MPFQTSTPERSVHSGESSAEFVSSRYSSLT